jgi:hypothetical protein
LEGSYFSHFDKGQASEPDLGEKTLRLSGHPHTPQINVLSVATWVFLSHESQTLALYWAIACSSGDGLAAVTHDLNISDILFTYLN